MSEIEARLKEGKFTPLSDAWYHRLAVWALRALIKVREGLEKLRDAT